MRRRVVLGLLGGIGMCFGLIELITSVPVRTVLLLAVWLMVALILHDLVWSPALIALGGLLARVPARARRYLQGALVVAGSLTVVAIPMIYVRGRQPPSKAILQQDVGANLLLLVGVVAAGALGAYLIGRLRDRGRVAESGGGKGPGPEQ